jgi:cytochrome c
MNVKNNFLIISALGTTALAIAVGILIMDQGSLRQRRATNLAETLTNGNTDKGYYVILEHGCGACHEIPGIPGAYGKVGSSLEGFKDKATIAGVLANTGENLIRWLQDPPLIDPKTAMPNLKLTPVEAQDAAAYLYAPR